MTIGVEFGTKTVTVDDTQVRLQIWDTVCICRFTLKLHRLDKSPSEPSHGPITEVLLAPFWYLTLQGL